MKLDEQTPKCPDCQEPADGLDGEHCQLCWENLSSDLWWQAVGKVQEAIAGV